MKKVIALIICFCGLLLIGCSQRHIAAHTSYLNRTQLASYHVNTPDPWLNQPIFGQRMIVSWTVPPRYLSYDNLHLEVTVRFGDRSQFFRNVEICESSGFYIYEIVGDDYFDKEGILSYKIDLIGGGLIIEEWRHQLWVDLITVGQSDDKSDDDQNDSNETNDEKDENEKNEVEE